MSALTSSIAQELKRKLNAKLPPQHMVGGGVFEVYVSFPPTISTEVYLDAMAELSLLLCDDYPGWLIEHSGKYGHIEFTFTK